MIDNPPYFVGWGTLTLINAGQAQGKGRPSDHMGKPGRIASAR